MQIISLLVFYSSKTKKVKYRASINLLKKVKKITNVPIIAIGGINDKKLQKLLLNKCRLFSYFRLHLENKKLKPFEAIKKFI